MSITTATGPYGFLFELQVIGAVLNSIGLGGQTTTVGNSGTQSTAVSNAQTLQRCSSILISMLDALIKKIYMLDASCISVIQEESIFNNVIYIYSTRFTIYGFGFMNLVNHLTLLEVHILLLFFFLPSWYFFLLCNPCLNHVKPIYWLL